MAPGRTRDVVFTYRYLRGAMIALLLMLLLSVVLQWWWGTGRSCWLGSISAYYYTPARTVFVGSLCALGASLVVYKGHSTEEDVLLNFSGLMAFVVAMVPTVPDTRCGAGGYTQTSDEIAAAVRNNIWSLLVVAVLAAVVAAWLRRRAMARDDVERPTARSVVVMAVCGAVLVGELVLFLVLRERFIALSHGIAAGTMVAGVIAVMVFSALRVEERHRGRTPSGGAVYKRIYIAIAVALGLALGVTVLAALTVSGFDHLILIAEVVIIVLFGTYWGVQTKELWDLRAVDGLEARTTRAVAE